MEVKAVAWGILGSSSVFLILSRVYNNMYEYMLLNFFLFAFLLLICLLLPGIGRGWGMYLSQESRRVEGKLIFLPYNCKAFFIPSQHRTENAWLPCLLVFLLKQNWRGMWGSFIVFVSGKRMRCLPGISVYEWCEKSLLGERRVWTTSKCPLSEEKSNSEKNMKESLHWCLT